MGRVTALRRIDTLGAAGRASRSDTRVVEALWTRLSLRRATARARTRLRSAQRSLVAVFAPSPLAVELGEQAGARIAGFVRGTSMNVYSHPQRIWSER